METSEIDIIRKQDVLLSNIEKNINYLLYENNTGTQDNQSVTANTSFIATSNDKLNSILKKINEFQISPQLLDKKLPQIIEVLYKKYSSIVKKNVVPGEAEIQLLKDISVLVYTFTKIRGIGLVATLLSTDIQYFSLAISRLRHILEINNIDNTHNGDMLTENWQEISFLLLWLSVLVLVPFNLKSLLGDLNIINELCFTKLIVEQENSNQSSYLNEINILLYSKYLSRSDSRKQLNEYYKYLEVNLLSHKSISSFKSPTIITHLKVLHKLLKLIAYDEEYDDLLTIHYHLVNNIFQDLQNENDKDVSESGNDQSPMVLKFVIKNFGQLAFKLISKLHNNNIDEDICLDRIENIISCMMLSIDHKDTSIRLTNAKNLAKITSLLSEDFQIDILENVISLLNIPSEKIDSDTLKMNFDFDLISINTYHGVFLLFAEFFTKRIISEDKYKKLVFTIIDPFFFFKRFQIGSVLVGKNIRDSVLFIVWAYLKYNQINEDILLSIFKKLVFVSLFDNDLIIRRSSGAVLQELIGRSGNIIWKKLNNMSNEFSVKFVESLDFIKLNDYNYTFFENSINYFTNIESLQTDFFEVLLNCDTNSNLKGFDIRNYKNNVKTGIFSIDDITKKNSAILLGRLVNIKLLETDRIIQIMKYLIDNTKENLIGTLYAISIVFDIIQENSKLCTEYLNENKELLTKILSKINDLKYDFHKDSSFKGESILRFLTSFLKFFFLENKRITVSPEDIINLIFKIIRKNNKFIDLEFKNLTIKMFNIYDNNNARWNLFLQKFNEKYIYFIKNGSLIACNNFGYLPFGILKDYSYLEEIKSILSDKKISYQNREKIIASCSHLIKYKDNQLNNIILDQMFDYTLTEQGDVGNIIRYAALNTIEENLSNFSNASRLLIEMRLLRLISEIIDKIKYKALKLLINLRYEDNDVLKEEKIEEYDELVLTNDYFSYYNYIFKIYYDSYLNNCSNDLLSYEFLKGICLSAGSLNGYSLNVVKAIDSCVYFFDFQITDISVRNKVINHILYLLRVNTNKTTDMMNYNQNKNAMFNMDDNIRFSCINLIAKLVDSGIGLTCQNDESQGKENEIILKKLYSRSYNIEIKTRFSLNLVNLVKIYEYLTTEKNCIIVKEKALQRLKLMFNKFKDGKHPGLQEKILQSLYNIYEDNHG